VCATTHVPYVFKQSVYAINNATSHHDVSRALLRLRLILFAGYPYNVIQHLHGIKWKEALSRQLFICLKFSLFNQFFHLICEYYCEFIEQLKASIAVEKANLLFLCHIQGTHNLARPELLFCYILECLVSSR
jgi:hypothetical protein